MGLDWFVVFWCNQGLDWRGIGGRGLVGLVYFVVSMGNGWFYEFGLAISTK